MDTLFQRREKIMYKYSKKCLRLDITNHMFPLNSTEHKMDSRYREKYQVTHAHTSHLMNSTVPYIQRLLNTEHKENMRTKRNVG